MKRIFIFLILSLLFVKSAWSQQDTIRVLAIGNSFSVDAVENYLYELGQDAQVAFIIGNLYIGGCSLERHWKNAESDKVAYRYNKIDENGVKTTQQFTLRQGILDEDWDVITFQQASSLSGIYPSYEPFLSGLLSYVRGAVGEQCRFAFHQTWAYAANSTHMGFAAYGNDQEQMYDAIVDAVCQAVQRHPQIDFVIPSGTAIQNGRTSSVGDAFCRDGFHLDRKIGRYTAACTWFGMLTGIDATRNTYRPASLPEESAVIARQAARYAVLSPYSVTDMSAFQMGCVCDSKH